MSESPLNRRDSAGEQPGAGGPRLVLVKGQQRYVFHCAPGQESVVLRRLRQLAEDRRTELSWFDAAVLAHQMGHHMRRRLKGSSPSRAGPGRDHAD